MMLKASLVTVIIRMPSGMTKASLAYSTVATISTARYRQTFPSNLTSLVSRTLWLSPQLM